MPMKTMLVGNAGLLPITPADRAMIVEFLTQHAQPED